MTDNFFGALACFPSGVTVVTATEPDREARGLTVSAFCSVSAEPSLVLVCVDLVSNTLGAIQRSGAFTVNMLAAGCEEVARRFASKSSEKFRGIRCETTRSGIGGPVLVDVCCAYLACRTEQHLNGGDHVVIIGHVEEARVFPDRLALLYGRRKFGCWPSLDENERRADIAGRPVRQLK